MSVQISTISAKVPQDSKTHRYFVEATLNSEQIAKKKFEKRNTLAQYTFDPPYSLCDGVTLKIQIKKKHRIQQDEVFIETEFTTDIAQRLLGEANSLNLTNQVLSSLDAKFEILVSFSMSQSTSQDLIEAAVEVSKELRSALDRMMIGRQFLAKLIDFGVAASELHPIAKGILASVDQLHKVLKEQAQLIDDIRNLVTEMADSLICVVDVRQFAKSVHLKEALEEIGPLVEHTANFVQEFRLHGSVSGFLSTLFQSRIKLDDLIERFESFKRKFDRRLAVQTGSMLDGIEKFLKEFFDDFKMRQDDAILEQLKSRNSTRTTHNECMSDTRVDILKSIDEWVDNLDGPNTFWLHGHPGTGKSTITLTVAERLRKTGRLGSSFFFQREQVASQSPASLWCSIAYDLAQKHPNIRQNATKKLRDGEIDLNQTSYIDIFDTLIVAPLNTTVGSNVRQGRHHVVLIDALDECGGLNEFRSYRKEVLSTLGRWPPQFKLLVTSRDEDDIVSKLSDGWNRCRDLEIGQNVTQQSSQDILAYLRFSLEEIVKPYPSIQRPWPNEGDLQDMTKAAAGLFIWASTVVKLVGDASQPTQTLAILLDRIRMGQRTSGLKQLERLYASILVSKFRNTRDISLFRQVSGAIIVARVPLPAEVLSKFLPSLNQVGIEFVCLQLKPVLDAGSDLRFTHQSFVDFLIDSSLHDFRFNRMEHEPQLALACFQIMARELHFNMGNIESSDHRNKDITNLSQRVEKHVSYSCFYWASHLEKLEHQETVHKAVLSFLESELLSWLEVLSIHGIWERASLSMASLATWASARDDGIKMIAQDCLSFIRAFGVPMSQAAPHIYLSGLAFSPRGSWIHRSQLALSTRNNSWPWE